MRPEDRTRIAAKLAVARLLLDARGVPPEEALPAVWTACRAVVVADPRLAATEHRLARAHERWLRGEPAELGRAELLAVLDPIERALGPADRSGWRAAGRRVVLATPVLSGLVAIGLLAWWQLNKPAPDDGLRGTYYPAIGREGQPFERLDHDLDLRWGEDAPMLGIPADAFSVVWEGCIVVDEPNLYLGIRGTDAFRATIDDELVLQRWSGEQELGWAFAGRHLPRGVRQIRVEHEHYTGSARLQLAWMLGRSGQPWAVPADHLVPSGGNGRHACADAVRRTGL